MVISGGDPYCFTRSPCKNITLGVGVAEAGPVDIVSATEVEVGCPSAGAGEDAGVGVSSKHPATKVEAKMTPAKNFNFIVPTNWA